MKAKERVNSSTVIRRLLLILVIATIAVLLTGNFVYSGFLTSDGDSDEARVAAFVTHSEEAAGQHKDISLNIGKTMDSYSIVLTNTVGTKTCETSMSYGLIVSQESETEWLPEGVTLTAQQGTDTPIPFVWNSTEKAYMVENAGTMEANVSQTDTWTVVFTMDPDEVSDASQIKGISVDALFTQTN